MFEKFITLVERIADALEVIAAAKASAPVAETTKPVEEKKSTAKKEAAAKKTEKAVEEKKVETEKLDELSDPLGEPEPEAKTREYTEKEVRDILGQLIDKDGRTSAFEVLRDKGNAKAFTDLKKDKYEDVYLECQERLA